DEDEDQFAGVHVAEQTQGQRNGLGQLLDQVEHQVERRQPQPERMPQQMPGVAAGAFDLDRIEDHQRKHRQRHAEGVVDIGGWHDAQKINAADGSQLRQTIDRQQIHEVHQPDPHEYGQCQRRDQFAVAVEDVANLGVDELVHDFDEVLHAIGRITREARRYRIEQPQKYAPEHNREKQRIDIDDPDPAGVRIEAERGQVELETGQVVLDILAGGQTLLGTAPTLFSTGHVRFLVQFRCRPS